MQSVRVDAIRVTVGREGIVLLLEMTPARQPEEQEGLEVRLAERVVLSPSSATRLSLLLEEILPAHEREPDRGSPEPRAQAEHMTGAAVAPDRTQAAVAEDRPRIATTYANTTAVAGDREAIDIVFGVERVRQPGESEVHVRPLKKISLSPVAARHLAIGLNEAVEGGEAKRGGEAERDGNEQGREPTASAARLDRVLMLFRQLGRLEARVSFEPSFKAVRDKLYMNRFLLGIDRLEGGGGRDEGITSICENIGMPRELLAPLTHSLPDANHVYFGVEKNDETLLFKAYLEFRDSVEEQIGREPVAGRSFLLFTGFKWDSFSPERQAVSQYMWYPSLPLAGILERLHTVLGSSRRGDLSEGVQAIATRASERIPHTDIQYLEVTEAGNPRRSFDINIYKSGLRVEDLRPELVQALRHREIPLSGFDLLYERIKGERIGHLAGGVDRDGEDFITVYYGTRDIHSSQLGSATIR